MTPLLAKRSKTDRAFERLYRQHVAEVYRYLLAVLHNPADAEDAAQNTFLSAYRAFQRGERPERPHNWLIKIAHNVCRQRFRQSSRRPKEVALGDNDAQFVTDDDIPTAEEIRTALSHLAFNQRAALVMRELEGRSYAEIAEILEISSSAVETLIFRSRRALREQLEGSLTCGDAELTLAKRMEGRLSPAEQGSLRAHLRACTECAGLERKHRAHRAAIKGLAVAPVPTSLTSLEWLLGGGAAVGGGSALLGSGLAAKVAIVVAAGLVAGAGQEAVQAFSGEDSPAAPVRRSHLVDWSFAPVSSITGGKTKGALIARRASRAAALAPGTNAAHRRTLKKSELEQEQGGETAAPDTPVASPAPPAGTGPATPSPPSVPALLAKTPKIPIPVPVVPPTPVNLPQPPLPPLPPVPQLPPTPPLPVPPPPLPR